jgi:tetratricopeptide (TPR) repeat protein
MTQSDELMPQLRVERMGRHLLSTVVAIIAASAPALANDEQDCFQGREHRLRIAACSKIIQRNPNDAAVYHNRGVAYGLAGDIESAIADYTKVIEIEPKNVTAYENRGRAYASKGDFTHAVADETKASELTARATTQPNVTTPQKPKKAIASKATKNVDKKTRNSSLWSWLWGNDGK